jgi:hypothetical protein
MAWHLVNRFIDHTVVEGLKKHDTFDNLVNGEKTRFTDKDIAIALVILTSWPTDKNQTDLFFPVTGMRFTRDFVGRRTGGLSNDAWETCLGSLESAGVFEITRTRGHTHVFRLGRLLDCQRVECMGGPKGNHFPEWASDPSVYPRGIPTKPRGLLGPTESGPLFDGDLNSFNTLNESLTTETEVSEVTEVVPRVVEVVQSVEATWGDWQEGLTENWIKQVLVVTQKKGLRKPSSLDIAHAHATFKRTGQDLESDGAWTDGRSNPIPKKKEAE